jgi:hypothetical protein
VNMMKFQFRTLCSRLFKLNAKFRAGALRRERLVTSQAAPREESNNRHASRLA